MTYLLRRGKGARRRKAHLCEFTRTGQPTMEPLCGSRQAFNMTSNVPWGCALCKNCRKKAVTIVREANA